jgi:uncharacterized protein YndB with AHSA1/START domain
MGQLQSSKQMIIHAPADQVWKIITDIDLLPKVTPDVLKAKGDMTRPGETRTIEFRSRGLIRKTTERLIDMVPQKLLVWQLESDTQLFTSQFRDTRFCFYLQKAGDFKTNVVCETCYTPATHLGEILNIVAVRKMETRRQSDMLSNIKSLAEGRY